MNAPPVPLATEQEAEIRYWVAATKPAVYAFLASAVRADDEKIGAILERHIANVAGSVLDPGCMVGAREEIALQLSARGILIACTELGLPVPLEVTAILNGIPPPRGAAN